MLGASGVLMGTRFFASEEALGNPAVKEKLLRANGDETVRSSVFDIARRLTWPAPISGRALRNAYVDHWLGREADLLRQIDVEAERYASGAETGDFDIAVVHAGEVVELSMTCPRPRS
jgi:nitronate monooxygenase